MKKQLLLFVLILLPMVANAYAVKINGVCYNLTKKWKTAEVIRSSMPRDEYKGNVVIPSTVTFANVTYNVTSIKGGAFFDCHKVTSVTIPKSVTNIGNYAFYGCSGLISIAVKSGNTTYDSRNNCNALIETSTNTLIAGCKTTVIPNSVTSIRDNAFSGCSGLTSVTIPNSVRRIENHAFYNCTGLTSVTIPKSVTNIGNYAFSDCTGLTSVTIGNSVISIGSGAFSDCTGLTSVTIPKSVTSIGDRAFDSCHGLTSVTIPNSVTSIGVKVFSHCSCLTSINIPNSVTSIGRVTFSGCTGLTSVTIPNNVRSIGEYAFYNCTGLTDLYCYAEKVPTTGSGVFRDAPVSSATLHVPAASINAYKAADQWKAFGKIVALTPEEVSVKSITATENPSDRKSMGNGRLIIQKNGQRYNAARQMVKDLSVDSGLRP